MKLKQVIASILTDLTQAQSLSDAYSREIKTAYKEDSLLRLLSVPKAEIKEIKLDLKIAFLQADRVVIYEHPSYQGKSQELREGSYRPHELVIDLDNEFSFKVYGGMKITFQYQFHDSLNESSYTEGSPSCTSGMPPGSTTGVKIERILTDEPTDDLRELHVEISTDELKQLPESALSSISITLSLSSI